MMCFRKFPAAINSIDIRGLIKTFRRKNFVSQCQKLSQLNAFVLCLRKLPVAKKIMDKSGVSRFSVERILYQNAEKFGN